jgi:uncharacterized protein (DUF2384 family)
MRFNKQTVSMTIKKRFNAIVRSYERSKTDPMLDNESTYRLGEASALGRLAFDFDLYELSDEIEDWLERMQDAA